jgi:hypothetical protein
MTKQKTSVKSARALYRLIDDNIFAYSYETRSTISKIICEARRIVTEDKGFRKNDRAKYSQYIHRLEVELTTDTGWGSCDRVSKIKTEFLEKLYPKTNPEWTIIGSPRREATLADLITP